MGMPADDTCGACGSSYDGTNLPIDHDCPKRREERQGRCTACRYPEAPLHTDGFRSCYGRGCSCQHESCRSSREPAGKKASVTLFSIKDPDGWGELINDLDLGDEMMRRYFKHGEYADVEIDVEVVGNELRVTGGRIVPQ